MKDSLLASKLILHQLDSSVSPKYPETKAGPSEPNVLLIKTIGRGQTEATAS